MNTLLIVYAIFVIACLSWDLFMEDLPRKEIIARSVGSSIGFWFITAAAIAFSK